MPAAAAFCPGCGREMSALPMIAQGKVGFFPQNIAGALAYISFIPAMVFLTLDPYRKDRFVRFHSVQCLLLWLAGLLVAGLVRLIAFVLFFLPMIGALLVWVLAAVAGLAGFFLWLALVVKALQGQAFKLPVLGDLAERYADPL
jgi:uncharacterized membrane protein